MILQAHADRLTAKRGDAERVTVQDIEAGRAPRTVRDLLTAWLADGWLQVANPARAQVAPVSFIGARSVSALYRRGNG